MIARIFVHGGRPLLEGVMDFGAVQPMLGMKVYFDMFEATVTEVTFHPDGDGTASKTDLQVQMTADGRFDTEEAVNFLTVEPFAALTDVEPGDWCLQSCCRNAEG